nr:hypothetical protein [Candidatus Sigynarchaeota archaeon]
AHEAVNIVPASIHDATNTTRNSTPNIIFFPSRPLSSLLSAGGYRALGTGHGRVIKPFGAGVLSQCPELARLCHDTVYHGM